MCPFQGTCFIWPSSLSTQVVNLSGCTSSFLFIFKWMLKLFHFILNCLHCPAPQYQSDLHPVPFSFQVSLSDSVDCSKDPEEIDRFSFSNLTNILAFVGPSPAWPTLLCVWLAKTMAPALNLALQHITDGKKDKNVKSGDVFFIRHQWYPGLAQ